MEKTLHRVRHFIWCREFAAICGLRDLSNLTKTSGLDESEKFQIYDLFQATKTFCNQATVKEKDCGFGLYKKNCCPMIGDNVFQGTFYKLASHLTFSRFVFSFIFHYVIQQKHVTSFFLMKNSVKTNNSSHTWTPALFVLGQAIKQHLASTTIVARMTSEKKNIFQGLYDIIVAGFGLNLMEETFHRKVQVGQVAGKKSLLTQTVVLHRSCLQPVTIYITASLSTKEDDWF